MKLSRLGVWWAPLGLLLAAGCANPMLAGPTAFSRIVTAQVGNGPAQATIGISSADYRLATIAHHWATSDIYEYDVSLSASGASSPLKSVTLTRSQSTATFTGLQHGSYIASMVAKGNDGGSAASATLTPAATAALDLTVNNTADATCTLTFDAVPFDATDTVTLQNPASDGVFASPTAPATVTVQ